MAEQTVRRRQGVIERAARIAFAFVVLNCSAVVGLVVVGLRRKVWR
jgi:hypothetical protein